MDYLLYMTPEEVFYKEVLLHECRIGEKGRSHYISSGKSRKFNKTLRVLRDRRSRPLELSQQTKELKFVEKAQIK
ncbi:hypothetical protein OIU74_000507 [Salix koriyanagi]|uniref:Uncharacterized protein n=1 Tax=Salix koriyanagi TaxID=2511006 RepID=A0A9Q0WZP1_9ROSI|nr:hypothetical protein OIU74_000507 [Salix koriyanagi]